MKKIEDVMNEWNALQPLSDRDREMLSRRFTIDFNYNSNHIEGNTLTYGQTEILLMFGKIVGEADVRDVHEMTASNTKLVPIPSLLVMVTNSSMQRLKRLLL